MTLSLDDLKLDLTIEPDYYSKIVLVKNSIKNRLLQDEIILTQQQEDAIYNIVLLSFAGISEGIVKYNAFFEADTKLRNLGGFLNRQ